MEVFFSVLLVIFTSRPVGPWNMRTTKKITDASSTSLVQYFIRHKYFDLFLFGLKSCFDLLVSCWISVVCHVPKTEKTERKVETQKECEQFSYYIVFMCRQSSKHICRLKIV